MIDDSTPLMEQVAYFVFIGLPLAALGLIVSRFIEAISPEHQTRQIDRFSLRLQKRTFFGKTPFGRYREPWKATYMHSLALFIRYFTIFLIGLWALKITSAIFKSFGSR